MTASYMLCLQHIGTTGLYVDASNQLMAFGHLLGGTFVSAELQVPDYLFGTMPTCQNS